jgi:CMP-N,N'-diacetyllegionaminic acid synthase
MNLVVGIIPARGGSKRIPRKNLALCAAQPLLGYTLLAAKSSRLMQRVLLSTDDDEIAAYGRANGVEVPYLRPAHLAADDTPMIAVLQDFVAWLDRTETSPADAVVLLQPTSPLRRAEHIDQAIELFRLHREAESVVSVVTPPHIFHPLKLSKPSPCGLVPYLDDMPPVLGHRDLPLVYARNGPAVLVTRIDVIRRGELYGSPSLPYVMAPEDSIDIDEPFDLEIAEILLKRRK